jgi:Tfp pilus assembly protein PilO
LNLRSPSATLVLGGLGLLLLAAAGWLLLLGPLTEDVGTARQAADDAVDRNQVLAAQLADLEERAQDLRSTRQAAEELERLVPPTADQPGFFALVDEAAAAAGYAPRDITTLSPTAPVPVAAGADPAAVPAAPAEPPAAGDAAEAPAAPVAEYAVQTVSMTLTGSYEQATRLLTRLGGLDRAVLVRSISLSGEAGSPTLTLTLSGTTFVAPPVPEPDETTTSQSG